MKDLGNELINELINNNIVNSNGDISASSLLAETKFYEGYSRWNEYLDRYETWEESVERVMNMHRSYYKDVMTDELEAYISEAEELYKKKYALGAQRALQFGGDQLLKHQMRMYNCTSSYADRPAFFGELFYILLCGAGAGFSVQFHHVEKLSKIQSRKGQVKQHIVEDSIEGWATTLDVLLSSYFEDGGIYPEYAGKKVYFDLSHIRPKGAEISGGFKAPGPEPLRKALDKIELMLQNIIEQNEDRLRPIHVYDICMHAADAVLAGGVRRSATICLFSPDDEEMLNAKTGNWFIKNPQRARSNNSAVIVRDEITREQFSNIMKSIRQFGEPGFYFVSSRDHTTNPCVEIGMFPQYEGESGWQGCNLTEINGSKCVNEEEFMKACRAASIMGTLQAGYTDFKFLSDTSRKIFEREALLGVSITGWMNNPYVLLDADMQRRGAEHVKEINADVARLLGINPAARTTCVKPSGNASVLLQTA
jgi:ribonucleoside-diphosphate reductase alpha chain